jgi:hypothetical protein
MTTNLQVNDQFPDIALPNHQNEVMRLSHFTRPSLLDKHLGFLDGYRTIRPDTPVKFELVEGSSGLTARNIQQIG